jgi:hypothetical protein
MELINNSNLQDSVDTDAVTLGDSNYCVDANWVYTAPVATAFNVTTGKIDQFTLNFADIGASTDGDFIVLEDATGALWGAALDVDGSGVTLAGAVWTAIPVAKKVVVDVSALTNDEDIAAAVVAALNALVGFTAKITLVANGDGTVLSKTATQYSGTLTGTYCADESGAGSTTVSVASAGVNPTVHTGTEIIDADAHGLVTGQAVKPTINSGSLPSPLVSGTEYYAIRVDADQFKLATSRALALAGTAINLSTEGTDDKVITITPQAVSANMKLQCSNNKVVWHDVSGVTTSVASGSQILWDSSMTSGMPKGVGFIRVCFVMTSGEGAVSVNVRVVAK